MPEVGGRKTMHEGRPAEYGMKGPQDCGLAFFAAGLSSLSSDLATMASLIRGLSDEVTFLHNALKQETLLRMQAEMKQTMLCDQQSSHKLRRGVSGTDSSLADHISDEFVAMHVALQQEKRLRMAAETKQAMLCDRHDSLALRSLSTCSPLPIQRRSPCSGPDHQDLGQTSDIIKPAAHADGVSDESNAKELDCKRELNFMNEHGGKLTPNAAFAFTIEHAEKRTTNSSACCEREAIERLHRQIAGIKIDLAQREFELEVAQESYDRTGGARLLQAFTRRKRHRLAYLEVRLKMRRYLKRLQPN